jgi:hypothetical protein
MKKLRSEKNLSEFSEIIGRTINSFDFETFKKLKIQGTKKSCYQLMKKSDLTSAGMTDETRILLAKKLYSQLTGVDESNIPDWLESNESFWDSNKHNPINEMKNLLVSITDRTTQSPYWTDFTLKRIQNKVELIFEFDDAKQKNGIFKCINNKNQFILNQLLDFAKLTICDDVNYFEITPIYLNDENKMIIIDNSMEKASNYNGIIFPSIKVGLTKSGYFNKKLIALKKSNNREEFLFNEVKDSLLRGFEKLNLEILDNSNRSPLDVLRGKIPFSLVSKESLKNWLGKTTSKKIADLYNSVTDKEKEIILEQFKEMLESSSGSID